MNIKNDSRIELLPSERNYHAATDLHFFRTLVRQRLIFLNTIYGVREGTLIAAFTIGNFSRFFRGYTNKLVREVALQ